MLHSGRGMFYVLAAGLIAVLWFTLPQLPPVVASHFDATGHPNGWSSRAAYAVLLMAIGILLPLGMVGLMTVMTRGGSGGLNLPAQKFWTRPEYADEAGMRLRAYMWWLGCVVAATTLSTHVLVVAAHDQQPPRLNTEALVLVLGAALLGVVAWCIGGYGLSRRPPLTEQ